MTRMIFYRFFLFLIIFSGLSKLYSQDRERIIFKIDDNEISSEEFIYTYEKNNINSDSLSQREAILDYLDLFINFKLKVQEAFDLGLDTTKAFTSEFNMYRDQLAEPYLKEKRVTDSLLQQAYNRLKWEVNASHILVRVQEDDTIRAYERIMTVFSKAAKGESFQDLALEYSEDPSVKQNQGNLGYFTALQMVYPFENAAYFTDVDKVSYPFRTRFGYHILKIHDRRPSKGEVEVAHIMLLVPQEATDDERRTTHLKIIEIREMLLGGADWDKIVLNYTEDQNTRNTGGILPPFSYGRMIQSFADASFLLSEPEEISDPVRTPYGWHIIKLIRKMPLEAFEIMKPELEQKITRDSRTELSNKVLINRLERENDFIEYSYSRNQLISGIKQKLDSDSFNIESNILYADSIIFSIEKENYFGKDIIVFVKKRNPSGVKQTIPKIRSWYEEFRESELIAYEKKHLEDKFYDFQMLINEYREGILLFDRMEDKVWNRATKDSTGLISFFEKNRKDYKWADRIYAHIYQSPKTDILDSVKQIMDNREFMIKNGGYTFPDPNPGLVANIIDSLIFSFRRDTTMLMHIVGDIDVVNKLKKPVLDSLKNKEWHQQNCIWRDSNDKELHIQLFTTSKKYLEIIFNENSTLNLQVSSDFFERGDNDILDMVDWEPGIYDLSIENQEYVVEIVKKVPPRLKNLDETRGKVISDYQEYLENQWIKDLKKTYKVDIYKKELKRIIQDIEPG